MLAHTARPHLASLAACVALCLVLFLSETTAVARGDLGRPGTEVILEVTGAVAHRNAPAAAQFDRAMLEALGTTTMRTSTPWTDGILEFRGVLARDLLESVGADGEVVRASALNDYVIDIPIADFSAYPVLLAFEIDGNPLGVRDKGPLWIVYPLDHYEDLQDRRTMRKMVWQLRELRVR